MEDQEVNPVLPENNEEQERFDLSVDEVKPEREETEQIPLQTEKEPVSSELPIEERLSAIEVELKRCNLLFESKLLYDTAKEDMITRLHKELQGYKDDLLKKTLKPVFMDMIMFADSMKALVSRYEETPETELILEKYQKLRKEFLKVGSHIDDVVYNYGIEPFSSEQGDEFNPRTQQAKKNTPADNPDEHKKIITSLSPGYTWDGQLLRRESVHVSICEQQTESNINQ
jgi:molecular chaperone GrpE (heat shock protein)